MCKQYMLFVFTFTIIICFADSAPPPSDLTICKPEDSKCLRETTKAFIPIFAAGLPQYNVPSLDPTKFKVINATQGNLLFVLTDVTAVGLKSCVPKKIQRDVARSKISIVIVCSGKLDGQYELKGQLLVLPIEGSGAIHADLNSVEVSIELDVINKLGEDGKDHWQIKSWTHSFELKEKSSVVFENLYKDNEVLGRAARELIESNGNDIIKEIGPGVIKAVVARVVKYINNLFKAIPAEELSIN